MCEYCGCQALRTIEELTREHDAALDLTREARQAVQRQDRDRVMLASRRLAALLAPHTEVEERAVFPAMRSEFPDHVDTLRQEQELIETALDESSSDTPHAGWEERLHEALDVLRAHIAKEQDGLFPAALLTLAPKDWEHAETVRRAVGSTLHEQLAVQPRG